MPNGIKTPPDVADAIYRLWKEGKTDAEISNFLTERGTPMTRNSIIGYRHRKSWAANARKPSPAAETNAPKPTRPHSAIHARATGAGGVNPATFRAEPKHLPPDTLIAESPKAIGPEEPIGETKTVEAPPPEGVEFFDLRDDQCLWVVNNSVCPSRYCGAQRVKGHYCQHHYDKGHHKTKSGN